MKSVRFLLVVFFVGLLTAQSKMREFQPSDSSKFRIDSLMRVAIRLYTEARFTDAIRVFTQAGADTGGAQARFYLGMSHLSLNEYDDARRHLEAAVRADSANTGYRFRLALMLAQLGESTKAVEHYETILQKDPRFVPALFNLGLLFYEQKEFKRSAELFNQAIRHNPRDFLAYFYLGVDMAALEKPDSARVCYATSMTLNRNYVPAISNLAAIHYEHKKYDEALRLFLLASSLRPSAADLVYKTGLCYQQRQNWEYAKRSFQRAGLLNPSRDDYAAQLGYAYFQLHKYDSSAYAYHRALSLDSTNSLYHLNLAFTYSSLDSVDQAVAEFHRAITYRHPEEIAKICNYLGSFYFSKNQFRKAIASYRRAIEYDTGNRAAQFYLALTYERLKDSRSASQSFQKYLTLQPSDTTQGDWKQYAKKRLKELKKRTAN
ncbi:MAG: tetratricopeptide repeat protein [Ignavibacteria bacterium]|nr:tetratricopeptide repeat protein [Ignavibacteria bacterium]